MKNHYEQFNKATELMYANQLEQAAKIFMQLQNVKEMESFCFYQLAYICNATGDPETAYNLYYQAFEKKPDLAASLYTAEHPSRNYVFKGKKLEKQQHDCPLCGITAAPYWVYPLTEASGYNSNINPIRMWMYCEPCHHLFARDFPENIFMSNTSPRKANPDFFHYYSKILSNIKKYAPGTSLFEVGVGASECLLVAREMGYEVFGIDVIKRHVDDAKSLYGLDAETADFNKYECNRKWDIVIMGDVLEHVSDPVHAIEKAKSLLTEKGALWISTPNFESAFSSVAGHNDVMRKQQYHLNYFSRKSLYSLLKKHNLNPVDYQISGHYNGSMEVIALL